MSKPVGWKAAPVSNRDAWPVPIGIFGKTAIKPTHEIKLADSKGSRGDSIFYVFFRRILQLFFCFGERKQRSVSESRQDNQCTSLNSRVTLAKAAELPEGPVMPPANWCVELTNAQAVELFGENALLSDETPVVFTADAAPITSKEFYCEPAKNFLTATLPASDSPSSPAVNIQPSWPDEPGVSSCGNGLPAVEEVNSEKVLALEKIPAPATQAASGPKISFLANPLSIEAEKPTDEQGKNVASCDETRHRDESNPDLLFPNRGRKIKGGCFSKVKKKPRHPPVIKKKVVKILNDDDPILELRKREIEKRIPGLVDEYGTFQYCIADLKVRLKDLQPNSKQADSRQKAEGVALGEILEIQEGNLMKLRNKLVELKKEYLSNQGGALHFLNVIEAEENNWRARKSARLDEVQSAMQLELKKVMEIRKSTPENIKPEARRGSAPADKENEENEAILKKTDHNIAVLSYELKVIEKYLTENKISSGPAGLFDEGML
ncbi:hypothetical protein FNU76_10760 [Chitinimonas arctica]|uniref:Uncharacterized protein n=1 Tax=Chitinimonas arctica TaxID=2594795 RepID=A0A516SF68_9NEIS|nr:hypothetical protein [Chitinimonas arctica]QDQ26806.1 hypothetical protein FNU76_10760 [Chitinimonas arctica]